MSKQPKHQHPHRTVGVEFDRDLWVKTQRVAEYDDRYLKTLITEMLRAGINDRFDEIMAEIDEAAAEAEAAYEAEETEAEDNTKPDEFFLGLLDTHEVTAA